MVQFTCVVLFGFILGIVLYTLVATYNIVMVVARPEERMREFWGKVQCIISDQSYIFISK